MKSELKEIELNEQFPCLMEYKLMGETSVGIYLVFHYPNNDKNKYGVCQIKDGEHDKVFDEVMYFKEKLNLKEWFFLPKGTQVTLTN